MRVPSEEPNRSTPARVAVSFALAAGPAGPASLRPPGPATNAGRVPWLVSASVHGPLVWVQFSAPVSSTISPADEPAGMLRRGRGDRHRGGVEEPQLHPRLRGLEVLREVTGRRRRFVDRRRVTVVAFGGRWCIARGPQRAQLTRDREPKLAQQRLEDREQLFARRVRVGGGRDAVRQVGGLERSPRIVEERPHPFGAQVIPLGRR